MCNLGETVFGGYTLRPFPPNASLMYMIWLAQTKPNFKWNENKKIINKR